MCWGWRYGHIEWCYITLRKIVIIKWRAPLMSADMSFSFSKPLLLDYLCWIQPRINENRTNGFCQKAHLPLFCCSLWLQKHTKKTQIYQDYMGSEDTPLYPSHAAVQLLFYFSLGRSADERTVCRKRLSVTDSPGFWQFIWSGSTRC